MAAQAHDHDHDHGHDKKAPARRRGPVGQQVVESMAGSGRMPDGVRLGGQFDPEETAADEVARRVVQQKPADDDASIISAARRAGANVPSGVRIHQGGRANAAAASMQASAFTVGSDVYLTDDAVRTPQQRIRVLAHELTHTGQDRGHGRHAPGSEPVVQRLWNPFKKKGPSRPSQGTDFVEEEREARRDAKTEERQTALTDAPTATTDLDSGLASGGHDSSTYDIGSRQVQTDANGTDLRGDDGWKQIDTHVSGSGAEEFANAHKTDAENMGEAAGLDTTLAGDFGGMFFSGRDARKKGGVDAGLAGTKAGALGLKGVMDGTSLGLQMAEHHQSGLTDIAKNNLHTGSQAMDHGAGWMGALTGGVGAMQDLKSWGSDTVDWFKGKRNMEKSDGSKLGDAKQVGLSMGRGVAKLGSATSKATGAVSKSANLVSQAAHGVGNTSLASNAASVGSSAAHVIAPLQMALGGVDVLKGGYNIYRKHQHKKKLDSLKETINKDVMDLDKDKKIKALDHLKEVAHKKQVRQGINMATGAASVLGGALTVSGLGAIPGAAIGAGVGAFKLAQFGARKVKQAGRNWAEKYNAKDESKKGAVGKAFAGLFDTSKSTKNKQARYEETADTLLSMDDAQKKEALKTLGIHNFDDVPTAQRKELIIEKLKKRT